MPEQLVVIWRDEPGQLINTIADGKKPKLFTFNADEVGDIPILSNKDAEITITKETFDRVAVTQTFAHTVLGWTV